MNFYCFGNKSNPAIILFPGTCCNWKNNFDGVIPYLKERFYTVCVSYDGFDENEDTVFPSMIEETIKIEEYIKAKHGGKIFAAYGCSLGGSFVGLLIQRGNIHIEHGFIGSSDLDQSGVIAAKIKAAIVAPVMARILHTGALPRFMQKRLEKQSDEERIYTEKMLKMMGISGNRNYVSKSSIYNQFYSDLVTPLDSKISCDGTKVHIFYAAKMGEKYLDRYYEHFDNPDIIKHDLQHEELLSCSPKEWSEEICRCCELI